MGIGIGWDDGLGMGIGIGASPQQPIFIPPSIGMPASIAPMAAGLLIPVIARPASIAPIDPEAAAWSAGLIPGMPAMPPFCAAVVALADGAGTATCNCGSTSEGRPELVWVGAAACGGMSMPPPHAASTMDDRVNVAARQMVLMGDSRFLY